MILIMPVPLFAAHLQECILVDLSLVRSGTRFVKVVFCESTSENAMGLPHFARAAALIRKCIAQMGIKAERLIHSLIAGSAGDGQAGKGVFFAPFLRCLCQ